MRAVLVLVACTTGCVVAPVCAVTPDASIDAFAQDDAFEPTDGALALRDGCTAISQGAVSIDRVFAMSDEHTMLECGHIGRVRIFDHASGALVYDTDARHDYRCPQGFIALPPGEYDVTADDPTSPQWSTGGAILHPERCPPGGPSGPFCPAQRVSVMPCETHGIMLTLYCDARAGDCPAAAFPWSAP